MKAPQFWWTPPDRPGWAARALAPLGLAWRAGAWLRRARARPVRTRARVLCVGNLTAGGGGKSPMVAALMQRLAARGVDSHVVSRGHGGRLTGPHLVSATDSFQDVGDEPLMLSAWGPVWVARNRAAGAAAAAEAGAGIVLMDDGFQNPGIVKDASILMVDAAQAFGNGRLIPAGPLREPIAPGLARADAVVLTGPDEARANALIRWPQLKDTNLIQAELKPLQMGLPLDGEAVVAFAGIANPAKFFATLNTMGAHVIAAHAFGDHQPFSPAILRRLLAEARGRDALLVTTEKDAVRLPSSVRREVITVQVALTPQDWSPIDAILDRLLAHRGKP